MERYAVSNEDGSLMEDISKDDFLLYKSLGRIVWISVNDDPYIMVTN